MEYKINKFREYEIREYDILDSTNEQAKRFLSTGHVNKVVITADSQTQGKGRGAREWVSENGNLFFSIIISSKKISQPELVSYIAALSVAAAMKGLGLSPLIKWPNDVLLAEKKLCGILPEKHKDFLIIGIGVNIDSSPTHLEGTRKAGHLNEYAKDVDREKFLRDIITSFDSYIERYERNGFEEIRAEVKNILYKMNEQIELDHLEEKIKGKIIDISPKGNLVIDTGTGRKEYRTGEIFYNNQ